MQSDRE